MLDLRALVGLTTRDPDVVGTVRRVYKRGYHFIWTSSKRLVFAHSGDVLTGPLRVGDVVLFDQVEAPRGLRALRVRRWRSPAAEECMQACPGAAAAGCRLLERQLDRALEGWTVGHGTSRADSQRGDGARMAPASALAPALSHFDSAA